MKRKPEKPIAFQDGGQFYDDATGKCIADYGDVPDYDMLTASRLRKKFIEKFPEYDLQ